MGLCCEIDPRLTNITQIKKIFAFDPHFADFTHRVGLWVNMAHHGSLRQMQQGFIVHITFIRDCCSDLSYVTTSTQTHSLLF